MSLFVNIFFILILLNLLMDQLIDNYNEYVVPVLLSYYNLLEFHELLDLPKTHIYYYYFDTFSNEFLSLLFHSMVSPFINY